MADRPNFPKVSVSSDVSRPFSAGALCSGLIAAAVACCAFLPSAGFAQQRIGQAAVVRNQVGRLASGQLTQIASGEDVMQNEVVRTGEQSSARLAFVDDTSLAIGAVSTVTLDRFVYGSQANYSRAVLDLGRGVFRFLTGASNKRAYEIVTPQATIGVRGTVLDIKVAGGETTVALQEGAAIVCPRSSGEPVEGARGCVTLTNPSQSALIRGHSASLIPTSWSFASACDGDGDLCGAPTYARNGVCVAGATMSGGCVNPDLADLARGRTITFSQSGVSATSPPYPPRRGREYLIPGAQGAPVGLAPRG